MSFSKFTFLNLFLFASVFLHAQKSETYTNQLTPYNHAIELYQGRSYNAAKVLFGDMKKQFGDDSELKARCFYYEAFCAIRLGEKEGEELMNNFFENFPTSTKRNTAFMEVGDYYFNNANYPYALKWYSRVNTYALNEYEKEDFQFKFAYGLFATNSFTKSKKYFSSLLNSKKYGAQAKYYYGYMAYRDDDFVEADKYLTEAASEKKSDKDISYFLVNIKFKTGKFQEAVDTGIPLLQKSGGIKKSELNKIIGESYFNLGEFEEAATYLHEYQGKKGRWNNTDYYQLGYVYYKQKDYETATEWFNKIIDGNNAVSQNAYYHLAECYLRSDKKTEALNAFRNASQMDFDKTIKQDAWLNYAKLSYEIGNPYQSTAGVIQEYLANYPTDINKNEIEQLLISSYISANDYQGAIEYLSDKKETEEYQKIAYLRGTQLFEEENFIEAKEYFETAKNNSDYNAKATFWYAESEYRSNNFGQALNSYEEFLALPNANTTEEFKDLDYNIGYTYFKLKDYTKSGGHFRQYIQSNPTDKKQIIDANMRLGDCYFALSNYYKAIDPYQNVIEANDIDVDFAQFQISLCNGFMGEYDKKINELEKFLQTNLKSPLRDDAFYELGNTYVQVDKNEKALNAYNSIPKFYPQSKFVPKALLKQGLIYYNTSDNNKALNKYKKVITEFPNSGEAQEAVANARQIYVDLGRVDEYEKLLKNVDFVNVSDKEIEATVYESAEKQYLNGNNKKAIDGFEKYLNRFPEGFYALDVNYYLADIYNREKKTQEAIPHYQYVIEKSRNELTENALVKLSEIYLKEENWEKAVPLLNRLENEADSENNIFFAQSNLMKGNYGLKQYEKAVNYAEKILQNEKIEAQRKSDAQLIIARSAFQSGDMYKAQDAFKIVENSASGNVKAEALYYDAYFKHKEGDYKNSNIVVQRLASEFAAYKIWGAKGLIIMSKNFYELEDAYQATYILENVMKNFQQFPEITQEARIELQKIKKEEAKTNESVIPEN
ncbi:MAG: tetratricopeptide repeat protein [Bacteroidota bacterium]